eukprot:TRINITY_DN66147_c0_g1_i1.p1 TRINITY_DN66147_c0_g1~~TRINITY_DN66147_c0_g1_i1.p1  ORF type:complete len:417 (+),score=80.15 TRINITY_DN66147_c0_g1_i1:24-1253(+)
MQHHSILGGALRRGPGLLRSAAGGVNSTSSGGRGATPTSHASTSSSSSSSFIFVQLRLASSGVSSGQQSDGLHVFGVGNVERVLQAYQSGAAVGDQHPLGQGQLHLLGSGGEGRGSAEHARLEEAFVSAGGSHITRYDASTSGNDSGLAGWRSAERRVGGIVSRAQNTVFPQQPAASLQASLLSMHEGAILEVPRSLDPQAPGVFRSIFPTDTREDGSPRVYICLCTDGMTPQDTGSVISVAAGFGLDGIILTGDNLKQKYLISDLSHASQGAVHQTTLYDGGDSLYDFVVRYADDNEEGQEPEDGTLRFLGIYHSSSRRDDGVVTMTQLEVHGQEEISGPTPWVILLGRQPGTKNPVSFGVDTQAYALCDLCVNIHPRNMSFYGVAPAAAVTTSAFMRAHARIPREVV